MGAAEVQVVTGSLHQVAQIWNNQATAIGSITPQVNGMSLDRIEAGIFQLIVSPYDAVVQAVAQRCSGGKTEMQNIATALIRNADNYAANEAKLSGAANNANPGH
jgi:hypothetical protein